MGLQLRQTKLPADDGQSVISFGRPSASMVPRGGDQQAHKNNNLAENGTQRRPIVSHRLFRKGSR